MNATLMVDSFTRDEQKQLLQALVDRLFPESTPDESEAFPGWIVKELEDQDERIQAGLESGEGVDVVEARLRARFHRQ